MMQRDSRLWQSWLRPRLRKQFEFVIESDGKTSDWGTGRTFLAIWRRAIEAEEKMKIIFFDIDGTLFGGGSQEMSESTKKAISLARQNGNLCFINTGRTRKLVGEEITGQVEFDGLLLGCGTMAVYHDEVLMHRTFEMDLSLRIMDGLKKNGIDAVLEGSEEVYVPKPEDVRTRTFREYLERFPKEYTASDISLAPGHFDKFFAYVDERERMDAFAAEFEQLDFIDRENGYFEVIPKGCSKATAIHYITDLLKIPMEDTVAIGDSTNDLPMLSCAHTSIAMGNATQTVKDMVDYVTTDVTKDGIWNALKWLGVLDK